MKTIKNKTIILIALILSFVISGILVKFIPSKKLPYPAYPLNLATKIVLAQTQEQFLSVKTLQNEKVPPTNYQLTFTDNFYTINLLDVNNKVIYSGQFANKSVSFPPDFTDQTPTNGLPEMTTSVPNLITLHIPYYKETRKIVILDENSRVKLEINKSSN